MRNLIGYLKPNIGQKIANLCAKRLSETVLSSCESEPFHYNEELKWAYRTHLGPRENKNYWAFGLAEASVIQKIVANHSFAIVVSFVSEINKELIREHAAPNWSPIEERRLDRIYKHYGLWQIREVGTKVVLIDNLPNPFGYAPIFTFLEHLANEAKRLLVLEPMKEIGSDDWLDFDIKPFNLTILGERIGRDQYLAEPRWWTPLDFVEFEKRRNRRQNELRG